VAQPSDQYIGLTQAVAQDVRASSERHDELSARAMSRPPATLGEFAKRFDGRQQRPARLNSRGRALRREESGQALNVGERAWRQSNWKHYRRFAS